MQGVPYEVPLHVISASAMRKALRDKATPYLVYVNSLEGPSELNKPYNEEVQRGRSGGADATS